MAPAALTHEASENVKKLAKPKPPHPEFLPERALPWVVFEAAKKTMASDRVEKLAMPQRR